MRNLKKVLVMVLCLAMMASIMVTGAAAAFTDQKDIDPKHQEAVDMSIALNIIEGYPDGSFQPNGNVTRAEMSKIICIALNGGEVPATSIKSTPTFADIKGHWAEGFIEYCYAKGVVAGKSADTFDPSGSVTGSEAAKMLLVALGYNQDVEKYVGSDWELYVNVQANQDGLYDKLLDIQTAEPLSREHAAQMIWNAIQAYIINKESSIDRTDGSITDNYIKSTTQDMLDKYYDGDVVKGQMISFNYSSKDKDWDYYIDTDLDGRAEICVNSATDYTSLIGQKVKAVYDMDGFKPTTANPYPASTKDAYGIFVVDSQVLFSGLVGNLPSLEANDDSIKFDGVKYKLDNNTVANTDVFEFGGDLNFFAKYDANGNAIYDYSNLNLLAGKVGTTKQITNDALPFYAVDYDGDGKVDFIVVTPFSVAKVNFVNADKIRTAAATFGDWGSKEVNKDDVTYYEGIAKDDYVAIVAARNTSDDTDVFTKIDTISGKVTMKDGNDVTVDGNVYTMDASFYTGSPVKAGTSLKDVAAYNGYLFAGDAFGNYDISDYVVVVGYDVGAYSSTAKLLFSDGSKQVVDLDTSASWHKDNDGNKVPNIGPADARTDLVVGQLYTYGTNSDKEYQLSPYKTGKTATGFDLASTTGTVVKQSSSSDKVGYIDNTDEKGVTTRYKVADDAVIYIAYDPTVRVDINGNTVKDANGDPIIDYSYKEVSGATLRTMNTHKTIRVAGQDVAYDQFNVKYVVGTKNSSTGMGEVNMAYLSYTESTVSGDVWQYGYILKSVEAQNADNADIYTITLFTKDGNVTLNTVKVTADKLAAGGDLAGLGKLNTTKNVYEPADSIAIAYTTDSDGNIDSVKRATGDTMNKAITGKDTKSLTVAQDGSLEFDDDAIILVVDQSETEAVEVGTVDSIAVAETDKDGNLVNNAFILRTSDNKDIACVVYDIDNGF